MQYSFRLAEILGHVPDPRKRPGTVKAIVEYTGLDRHQVSALLKNEVKYIPLKALSRLCDYLVEHGYVTADQLPGALFAVEPENFWELLARRQRVEMCLGVRRATGAELPHGSWLVASDSLLMGELLNGISTLGGPAKMQSTEANEFNSPQRPHPELLKQSLVWSPADDNVDEMRSRSHAVYEDFVESTSDRALIGLGSVKSNSVIELIVSNTFDCDPFVNQRYVDEPSLRSCPFMLRYRDEERQPESCIGGVQLSANVKPDAPGIYFETEDGTWDSCTWNPDSSDIALVFYVHRESLGRLEMFMGGFSGRATQMLARVISTRAEEFWPPVYSGHGIQIGAFVVSFEFAPTRQPEQQFLIADHTANTRIIPLSSEAIARRLE